MKRNWVWLGAAMFFASLMAGAVVALEPSPHPTPPLPTAPLILDAPDTRYSLEESKQEQLRIREQQKAQLREKAKTLPAVIIGTYTTDLGSHNEANRVHNIKLSLSSINQWVLLPGETFSFHGAIGDSTNGKLGYKPAAVIVGNEYATDYGGGICQVSSTLYNAVANAELKVTERYSHSLPVDYVPKGRDATVSYPDLDFKFVNTTESPVRIQASLQGSKVICTILKATIGE